MFTPLAHFPAVSDGESILFGTSSEGVPYLVRYSATLSNAAEVFMDQDSQSEMKGQIESRLRVDFGPLEQRSNQEEMTSAESKEEVLVTILDAANAIGWDRVTRLSPDCRLIEFTITDRRCRSHSLTIRIDPSDQNRIHCDVSLPQTFLDEIESRSIVAIYELFINAVEGHQLLWDDLAEVDEAVYILEPTRPTFCDTRRVIHLEPQVRLEMLLNPSAPRALPKLELTGPLMRTRTYQRLMDDHLTEWDDECSLLENLLRVFGKFEKPVDSVAPTQGDGQSLDEENDVHENDPARCEVCYGSDQSPQLSCTRCQRIYHQACLYQCTRRKTRTFGAMFCHCPHCGQAISMKGTAFC